MPERTYRITICIDVVMTNADTNRLESRLIEHLSDLLDRDTYRPYVKNIDSAVDFADDDDLTSDDDQVCDPRT